MDKVKPNHYDPRGPLKLECFDVIESIVEPLQGAEAAYMYAVVKYLWRYKQKDGITDLYKAKQYLKKLIEINKHEEAIQ
jgi:hypothetical protein